MAEGKAGTLGKRKRGDESREGPALLALPRDALLSALARTSAADHDCLRGTCRSLRDLLGSAAFRSERLATGWAEVSTSLLTGYELYAEQNPSEAADPDIDDEEIMGEYYNDLGEVEELGIQGVKARIMVDGKIVGSSIVKIVPRQAFSYDFHEACDSYSGELKEVGWTFCDRFGRPRLSCLKAAGPEASAGGFAYIETFDLDPEYRSTTDVGARALRSLLGERLAGLWTVAAYVSDARAHFTESDKDEERRLTEFFRSLDGNPTGAAKGGTEISTAESGAERWEQRAEMLRKYDMRQFFRAGFKQATELVPKSECYHMFAVPSFLTGKMLSHSGALSVKIVEKAALPPKPSGLDADIFELVKQAVFNERTPAEVRSGVSKLISEGGTIEGSHAIHCCAYNGKEGLIDLLVGFATSAKSAVNSRDASGWTPLMLAATIDCGRKGCDPAVRHSMCKKLIHLGANKAATDPCGRTALGCLRANVSDYKDFMHSFGIKENEDEGGIRAQKELEDLLWPPLGPTDSDNAALWEEDDPDEDLNRRRFL